MPTTTLALDLERTLISDAFSAIPRPGLFRFLQFCEARFSRIVLYTSVETPTAREVLTALAESGHVPSAFLARLEYVEWSGEYKDLSFIQGASVGEVLIVDDDAGWIRPDQRHRWIAVPPWDGGDDAELLRIEAELLRT